MVPAPQLITLQKLGISCRTLYVIYTCCIIYMLQVARLGKLAPYPYWSKLGKVLSMSKGYPSLNQQTDLPFSKILGQSQVISWDSRVDLPQLPFSWESWGILRLALKRKNRNLDGTTSWDICGFCNWRTVLLVHLERCSLNATTSSPWRVWGEYIMSYMLIT